VSEPNFSKVFDRPTEAQVEKYLVSQIQKLGGIAYKFTSPARRSVPDRLCMLPMGVIVFVECKKPGGAATALQMGELKRLWNLDHWATVVSTKTMVDALIDTIKEEIDVRRTNGYSSNSRNAS